MDRRGTVARVLTGAALLLFQPAAANAPSLPIAEARWLAPDALFEGLTRQPPECLAPPKDKAARRSVAIGRAAFRAPLLLGGQAARAGLSCASCHRNGRGNPHFSFPGLSGAPGTADVTSSLMSKRRGDGTINPKPIPDLAAATQSVSRDPRNAALESFIRGLIVEEFDGAEPPPAVLRGLVAYVRAIRPEFCGAGGAEPVTLDAMLSDVDVASALHAARSGDSETARLLLGAARSALGRIDERFRLPGLEASRALLVMADAELRDAQHAEDKVRAIRGWRQRWPQRRRMLRARAESSLFSAANLRARLYP